MTGPGRRLLGDRYALEGLIALGGMGQVWRARDTSLGRPVAVKVLRSEHVGDATFLARFRAEAQHSAALCHPNIAAVHDYGEQRVEGGVGLFGEGGEHVAYMVMELVEGESLSSVLDRTPRLSAERTLDVVRQTAAGLAAAHAAGVVHRDVKPGNLLVGDDGIVKITDFGIAWSAASVPLTRTGQVVGTAHYLSPEQAQGAKASPASDVYALGMVAYECLAGRRAFEGDNSVAIALRQIREEPDPLPADVPAPVRALVEHMLAKDPAQRIRDGAALLAAVDAVRAGGAPPAAAPPPTRALPLPAEGGATAAVAAGDAVPAARRRRLLPALGALAGAAVVAGVLVTAGSHGGTATPAEAAPVTSPAAPTSAVPSLVTVHAADVLGLTFADARARLSALGLVVARADEQRADVAPGLVTAVDPVGGLLPGRTVTLTVAAAPPAPATTSAPSTPPPAAVVTAPAPAPATQAKAPAPVTQTKGRGSNKGHGKKDDD